MGKQELGRWDAAYVLFRYQISLKRNWVSWRRAWVTCPKVAPPTCCRGSWIALGYTR